MKVGVLALQGDIPEHLAAVAHAAAPDPVVPVRTPTELAAIDALCLPGGESTTIARLLVDGGLWHPLAGRLNAGLPVFATCAGFILLARALERGPTGRDPPTFGRLDVTLRRNDYGSQRESCEAPVRLEGVEGGPFPGVFIRAPRVLAVGPGARPIAWREDEVVGVRDGNVWGFTFHPELSGDPRLHRAFLTDAARRPPNPRSARR